MLKHEESYSQSNSDNHDQSSINSIRAAPKSVSNAKEDQAEEFSTSDEVDFDLQKPNASYTKNSPIITSNSSQRLAATASSATTSKVVDKASSNKSANTRSKKRKSKSTYSIEPVKEILPTVNQAKESTTSDEADPGIQNSTEDVSVITGHSSHSRPAATISLDTASKVVDESPNKSAGTGKRTKRKRKYRKKVLTRKRLKLEHLWIDVQSKRARNAGTAGEGRKGKEFQKRTMGYGCATNCRFKCRSKISKKNRKKAFDEFWNLRDKVKQWQCLTIWVKPKPPINDENDSDESNFEYDSETEINKKKWQYTLPSSEVAVVVCKKMFLNTLGK